jgi:hypothetical protein
MLDIGIQQAQTISWLFLMLVFFTRVFDVIWQVGMGLADMMMKGWATLLGLFLG